MYCTFQNRKWKAPFASPSEELGAGGVNFFRLQLLRKLTQEKCLLFSYLLFLFCLCLRQQACMTFRNPLVHWICCCSFFHLLISTHLKESHVIPGLHAPACQQTLKHLPWTYKKNLSSNNSKEWDKEGAETCTGALLWIFKILQNTEMPFPFFVCLCARERYAISVGITWSLGE